MQKKKTLIINHKIHIHTYVRRSRWYLTVCLINFICNNQISIYSFILPVLMRRIFDTCCLTTHVHNKNYVSFIVISCNRISFFSFSFLFLSENPLRLVFILPKEYDQNKTMCKET